MDEWRVDADVVAAKFCELFMDEFNDVVAGAAFVVVVRDADIEAVAVLVEHILSQLVFLVEVILAGEHANDVVSIEPSHRASDFGEGVGEVAAVDALDGRSCYERK